MHASIEKDKKDIKTQYYFKLYNTYLKIGAKPVMPRKISYDARELEELVEDVYSILKRMGGRVNIIEYPNTPSSRAIDLVSTCTNNKRLFARVIYDAAGLGKNDVAELKASARMYSAAPIIISKYINGVETEEDVVYEKYGINTIGLEALRAIIYRDEKIYIHHIRGTYTVKINPEKMRKRRKELGLSLGDLANMLGVSRKAIYEYEKGAMNLSVEKAIKLVEILGEDILEPVNVFDDQEIRVDDETGLRRTDTRIEEQILTQLESKGFKVYHLRKTPIDIVAKKDEKHQVLSIIVKHFISERKFKQKVNEAEKIVELTYSKSYVIKSENDIKEINKEL